MTSNPFGVRSLPRIDVAAVTLWNYQGKRSRESYFREHPIAAPRTTPCGCGRWFVSGHARSIHRVRSGCTA